MPPSTTTAGVVFHNFENIEIALDATGDSGV